MVPVAAPIKVGPKVNTPVSTNKMIVANTKAITTTEAVLLSGARVTLRGNISSEADKTLLENYINRLDHVVVVTNQLALSDNNANLLITITGRNVDGSALENIRTSINAKLKELKIEPDRK
jgi:hypothetical protein